MTLNSLRDQARLGHLDPEPQPLEEGVPGDRLPRVDGFGRGGGGQRGRGQRLALGEAVRGQVGQPVVVAGDAEVRRRDRVEGGVLLDVALGDVVDGAWCAHPAEPTHLAPPVRASAGQAAGAPAARAVRVAHPHRAVRCRPLRARPATRAREPRAPSAESTATSAATSSGVASGLTTRSSGAPRASRHSGMFPCFFGGQHRPLGAQQAQRLDDLGAGLVRGDHAVDVAALGGHVGVGERVLVLRDELGAPGLGVASASAQLLAVEDVDRALGAHHRDLGGRPGEVDVGAEVLGAHHVVRAAVGLAGDHRDQRDGGLGVGVDQLRAAADDAVPLLVGAGQEAGDVDEGQHRDVEGVAEPHEPGGLLRGVDVEACRRTASAGWRRRRPTGPRPGRSR